MKPSSKKSLLYELNPPTDGVAAPPAIEANRLAAAREVSALLEGKVVTPCAKAMRFGGATKDLGNYLRRPARACGRPHIWRPGEPLDSDRVTLWQEAAWVVAGVLWPAAYVKATREEAVSTAWRATLAARTELAHLATATGNAVREQMNDAADPRTPALLEVLCAWGWPNFYLVYDWSDVPDYKPKKRESRECFKPRIEHIRMAESLAYYTEEQVRVSLMLPTDARLTGARGLRDHTDQDAYSIGLHAGSHFLAECSTTDDGTPRAWLVTDPLPEVWFERTERALRWLITHSVEYALQWARHYSGEGHVGALRRRVYAAMLMLGIEEVPQPFRDMMAGKGHPPWLTGSRRARLWCFLLHNGVPADVALEWLHVERLVDMNALHTLAATAHAIANGSYPWPADELAPAGVRVCAPIGSPPPTTRTKEFGAGLPPATAAIAAESLARADAYAATHGPARYEAVYSPDEELDATGVDADENVMWEWWPLELVDATLEQLRKEHAKAEERRVAEAVPDDGKRRRTEAERLAEKKTSRITQLEQLSKQKTFTVHADASKVRVKQNGEPDEQNGVYRLPFTGRAGVLKVEYAQKKGFGRRYPRNVARMHKPVDDTSGEAANLKWAVSCQGCAKDVRKACLPFLHDLDISACHPAILSNKARAHGIDAPTLHDYVGNTRERRARVAAHHGTTLDQAKTLFTALVYGGSYEHRLKSLACANRKPLEYVTALQAELHALRETMMALPEYADVVGPALARERRRSSNFTSAKLKTEEEARRSVWSQLTQEFENQALRSIQRALKEEGLVVHSLQFDGLCVMHAPNMDVPGALAAARARIEADTGMRLELEEKPLYDASAVVAMPVAAGHSASAAERLAREARIAQLAAAYYADQSRYPVDTLVRLLHRRSSPVHFRELAFVPTRGARGVEPEHPLLTRRALDEAVRRQPGAPLCAGPAYDAATQVRRGGEQAPSQGTELVLTIAKLPDALRVAVDGAPDVPATLDSTHAWRWLRQATLLVCEVLADEFGVGRVLLYPVGARGVCVCVLDEFVVQQTREERDKLLASLAQPTRLRGWGSNWCARCVRYAKEMRREFGIADGTSDYKLAWPSIGDGACEGHPRFTHLPFGVDPQSGCVGLPFASLEAFPTCADDLARITDDAATLHARIAASVHAVSEAIWAMDTDVDQFGYHLNWMLSTETVWDAVPAMRAAPWCLARSKCARQRVAIVARGASLGGLQRSLGQLRDARKRGQSGDDAVHTPVITDHIPLAPLHIDQAKLRHLTGRTIAPGAATLQTVMPILRKDVCTYFPDLNMHNVLDAWTASERRAVTGGSYAELAVAQLPLACAWASVVAAHDNAAMAHQACPVLGMFATDTERAVEIMNRQLHGVVESEAAQLRMAAVALLGPERDVDAHHNGEVESYSCPFLGRLRLERSHIGDCAEKFAPLQGANNALRTIRFNWAKEGYDAALLTYQMETLQNIILVGTISALGDIGWEVGGVTHDAWLVRARDATVTSNAQVEAAQAACIVQDVALQVGVEVSVSVSHSV